MSDTAGTPGASSSTAGTPAAGPSGGQATPATSGTVGSAAQLPPDVVKILSNIIQEGVRKKEPLTQEKLMALLMQQIPTIAKEGGVPIRTMLQVLVPLFVSYCGLILLLSKSKTTQTVKRQAVLSN